MLVTEAGAREGNVLVEDNVLVDGNVRVDCIPGCPVDCTLGRDGSRGALRLCGLRGPSRDPGYPQLSGTGSSMTIVSESLSRSLLLDIFPYDILIYY